MAYTIQDLEIIAELLRAEVQILREENARLRAFLPDPREMSGWSDPGAPNSILATLGQLAVMQEIEPPELIGGENYKTLIIGWGSTYYGIKEALKRLEDKEFAFLHYKQVYPLHPDTKEYLKKADRTVLVENNATGQFGSLIRMETGIQTNYSILKYDGLPFSVEQLVESLKKIREKENK